MTHSLGEEWVLDDDHTAHGFGTDPVDLHVPHALGAIWGCEPTELYLRLQIFCESCSATVIQLNFDLLLPGANL